MERRRFSKGERIAIFLAADGKSELTGVPLDNNWHADHIVPFAKGGQTDVINGQALTATENLRKAATTIALRPWQRNFQQVFEGHADVDPDFMLAAIPGGGKTIAALSVAAWYLVADVRRQLIIVVPTLPVRDQWRSEASRLFQIHLQTKDFLGNLKEDFRGVITTYAAVVGNYRLLFRKLCAMHPCMVIFDEIHHAGDQSTWGMAIQDAFEGAEHRLCLSGTPFKTDGQKIPFLKVKKDKRYQIDFEYGYKAALEEGVVRMVSFHRYDGGVDLERPYTGGIVSLRTNQEDLAITERNEVLGTLLRQDQWTRDLLIMANQKLMAVRESKPDAGGLALCIDSEHAEQVAKLLEQITGTMPDVVLSDVEKANSSIATFRKSKKPWIVAVRMVSEGVDIKRLIVLAYLTNYTSELFFCQAIGRIMRNEGTEVDAEAYCFMPADPRLGQWALTIENFQDKLLEQDKTPVPRERGYEPREWKPETIVVGCTGAEFAGITASGSEYAVTDAVKIQHIAVRLNLPESKSAEALALFKEMASEMPQSAVLATPVSRDLEDELDQLRKQSNRLAVAVARKEGIKEKDVHKQAWKHFGKPQAQMSKRELEMKIEWLRDRLQT